MSSKPLEIISTIPPPTVKRYAHSGKRRRSYTEEMFRCQFTDMISRTALVCNHLLWRNRPDTLREHLLEHLSSDEVAALTDAQVVHKYTKAGKIYLEEIPEDSWDPTPEDEDAEDSEGDDPDDSDDEDY